MYHIDTVENVDISKWKELLWRSKDALVTHSVEWARALCEAYQGMKHIFIIATDSHGDYVGGMPIVTQKRKGFQRYWSTYGGPYGGFLIRDGMSENLRNEGLRIFFQIIRGTGSNALIYDFFQRNGLLKTLGFKEKKRSTHVIELDMPFEEILMKKIGKKARTGIRQAIERGVVIEELESFSDSTLSMILHTSRRCNRQPYPQALYKSIFEIMVNNGLAKWLVAKYNQKPIATSVFLMFKDYVQYWMNSSYSDYWRLRPNNLILSEMIKWSCENGYKNLDLGPSDQNYGLIKFKEDMGGNEMRYKYYEKSTSMFRFGELCLSLWTKCVHPLRYQASHN